MKLFLRKSCLITTVIISISLSGYASSTKEFPKENIYKGSVTKPLTLSFAFNYTATTPLLHPPYISGVVEDPTDPAATFGFVVDIKENDKAIPANDYTLTAVSSNTLIIHNNNILITKADGQANIKIIPSGFGYSNVTLTLTKGKSSETLVVNYAASAAVDTPANTFWHTGISDASAAIALDSNYMVIGDDEQNELCVYHRFQSGLPVAVFKYEDFLGLADGNKDNYKEVDCEAATRSLIHPERVYWTGSMSNGGKRYEEKPNRNCLFATDISGTGATTKFVFAGVNKDLRKLLINWGDKHGYKFSASATSGTGPKRIDGFNIEGIVFAPDSTTLYIGFRAPLVPVTNRTNALIAPIQNFEQWFNNGGHPSGNPVIGEPIELNLGGRSVRDIIHLTNGKYIIVAGTYDEILNGAVYSWSGKATDQPVLLNTADVFSLSAEGAMEMFENGKPLAGKLQLISDNGSARFYNDGVKTKLLQPNFKKFRSDIIHLP